MTSVAIVGAGLAGLVAARRLERHGVDFVLYEAGQNVGGRARTLRGRFSGCAVEEGGEFVDTGHAALLALVDELGLEVVDLHGTDRERGEPALYFRGGPYAVADAAKDLRPVLEAARADLRASGDDVTALDALSVREWIDERVPGGADSRIGRLLDVAYNVFIGGETSDQSSLNIVWTLASGEQGDGLSLYGSSDERYRIRGGSDEVPRRLAAALSGRIVLGHRLSTAAGDRDGRVRLQFEQDAGGHAEVTADRVILAIPFTTLREVELDRLDLPPRKTQAIAELGMGNHVKLFLEFSRRHWLDLGCDGETYSDTGYQSTWEAAAATDGPGGVLVNFASGDAATAIRGLSVDASARAFLERIEPVLPGLSRHWTGEASLVDWPSRPLANGSYSYYRVGQYTELAEAAGRVQGHVHFAGEHTSPDFQGYMEGAVRSGERAAAEVVEALG